MTRTAVLIAVALVVLAGCGKKPGDVLPPPGANPALFPRSYPNPALDPLLNRQPTQPLPGQLQPAPPLPAPHQPERRP